MSEKFKVGDRVRVEYEGTVSFARDDTKAVQVRRDPNWDAWIPDPSALTLIERPVEPLAPGSVVRAEPSGDLWSVLSTGLVRCHGLASGTTFRSAHTPKTLAREVRDNDDFTLIYDGGKNK